MEQIQRRTHQYHRRIANRQHKSEQERSTEQAPLPFSASQQLMKRNNDSTTDWGNPSTSSAPILNGVAYGMAYRVTEFVQNFTTGSTPDPDDTETDGTISIQTVALQDANDQLDDDIASLELLLASREQQMTNSFIRMEEMQSQLQGQMQMLQSSFQSNGISKK